MDNGQEVLDRDLAPLRNPALYQPGLSGEDEQTLCDIANRVERLLEYHSVLPAVLVAMLRDYLPELRDMTGGRWEGVGILSQCFHLSDKIAQHITDGKWAAGDRVYSDPYYLSRAPRQTLCRAMQVLAARGEVAVRHDGYYVRSRDDNLG